MTQRSGVAASWFTGQNPLEGKKAMDRADDANECIIRHRLEVYQRDTARVLKYYPMERIVKIDALRSPVEVLDQILDVMISLLSRRQARSPPI